MKEKTPAWLAIGMPAIIFLAGVHAIVTKSFFMAGGAKGGTSEMTGTSAMWAGAVMILLAGGAFLLFRYLDKKT